MIGVYVAVAAGVFFYVDWSLKADPVDRVQRKAQRRYDRAVRSAGSLKPLKDILSDQ
jgi:hypothetical protein